LLPSCWAAHEEALKVSHSDAQSCDATSEIQTSLLLLLLLQVQGPFRMLNMINFLVFRVTRGVLFALEICMASPDAAMIVSALPAWSTSCGAHA
jgi:hypothetical protein